MTSNIYILETTESSEVNLSPTTRTYAEFQRANPQTKDLQLFIAIPISENADILEEQKKYEGSCLIATKPFIQYSNLTIILPDGTSIQKSYPFGSTVRTIYKDLSLDESSVHIQIGVRDLEFDEIISGFPQNSTLHIIKSAGFISSPAPQAIPGKREVTIKKNVSDTGLKVPVLPDLTFQDLQYLVWHFIPSTKSHPIKFILNGNIMKSNNVLGDSNCFIYKAMVGNEEENPKRQTELLNMLGITSAPTIPEPVPLQVQKSAPKPATESAPKPATESAPKPVSLPQESVPEEETVQVSISVASRDVNVQSNQIPYPASTPISEALWDFFDAHHEQIKIKNFRFLFKGAPIKDLTLPFNKLSKDKHIRIIVISGSMNLPPRIARTAPEPSEHVPKLASEQSEHVPEPAPEPPRELQVSFRLASTNENIVLKVMSDWTLNDVVKLIWEKLPQSAGHPLIFYNRDNKFDNSTRFSTIYPTDDLSQFIIVSFQKESPDMFIDIRITATGEKSFTVKVNKSVPFESLIPEIWAHYESFKGYNVTFFSNSHQFKPNQIIGEAQLGPRPTVLVIKSSQKAESSSENEVTIKRTFQLATNKNTNVTLELGQYTTFSNVQEEIWKRLPTFNGKELVFTPLGSKEKVKNNATEKVSDYNSEIFIFMKTKSAVGPESRETSKPVSSPEISKPVSPPETSKPVSPPASAQSEIPKPAPIVPASEPPQDLGELVQFSIKFKNEIKPIEGYANQEIGQLKDKFVECFEELRDVDCKYFKNGKSLKPSTKVSELSGSTLFIRQSSNKSTVEIHFIAPDGSTTTLQLNPWDRWSSVMSRVKSELHINSSIMLKYNSQIINEDDTVSMTKIPSKETVEVIKSEDPVTMQMPAQNNLVQQMQQQQQNIPISEENVRALCEMLEIPEERARNLLIANNNDLNLAAENYLSSVPAQSAPPHPRPNPNPNPQQQQLEQEQGEQIIEISEHVVTELEEITGLDRDKLLVLLKLAQGNQEKAIEFFLDLQSFREELQRNPQLAETQTEKALLCHILFGDGDAAQLVENFTSQRGTSSPAPASGKPSIRREMNEAINTLMSTYSEENMKDIDELRNMFPDIDLATIAQMYQACDCNKETAKALLQSG